MTQLFPGPRFADWCGQEEETAMTHYKTTSNRTLKAFGLLALVLGAVACAPGSSNDESGAQANLVRTNPAPSGMAPTDAPTGARTGGPFGDGGSYSDPCTTDLECRLPMVCVTNVVLRPVCGCPLFGPLSDICLLPTVHGQVHAAGHTPYDAVISLLMQDPAPPPNADGVPVESYSVVRGNTFSTFSGEFGFWGSLDDGVYMVSASFSTGERGQTEPLTLAELTSTYLSVNLK
jgi:hypothetical protein